MVSSFFLFSLSPLSLCVLAQQTHGHLETKEGDSVGRSSTEDAGSKPLEESSNTLLGQGLASTVNGRGVLASARGEAIGLQLGLDHINGVHSGPHGVTCAGTVGNNLDCAELAALLVLDAHGSLDKVLVSGKVGTISLELTDHGHGLALEDAAETVLSIDLLESVHGSSEEEGVLGSVAGGRLGSNLDSVLDVASGDSRLSIASSDRGRLGDARLDSGGTGLDLETGTDVLDRARDDRVGDTTGSTGNVELRVSQEAVGGGAVLVVVVALHGLQGDKLDRDTGADTDQGGGGALVEALDALLGQGLLDTVQGAGVLGSLARQRSRHGLKAHFDGIERLANKDLKEASDCATGTILDSSHGIA